jgi:hypothetical protein
VPERCSDVFAWRRTFMSSVGPSPLTRLVLQGMSLFMAPSGGGCCWLSVRRLAELTGLDKGTISKHRTQAVATGWLIAGANPRHRQSPTFWCAIPDGIPIFQSRADGSAPALKSNSAIVGNKSAGSREPRGSGIGRRTHLLSGGTVQSQTKPYVLKAETVRSGRTNRPFSPDQSSISINDLQKATSDTMPYATSAVHDGPVSEESARVRLDAWIRSAGFLQICQSSPGLALKLTPPNCRVRGYESLIREAIERANK